MNGDKLKINFFIGTCDSLAVIKDNNGVSIEAKSSA